MITDENLRALLLYGVTLNEGETIRWIGHPSKGCAWQKFIVKNMMIAVPAILCFALMSVVCGVNAGEPISIFRFHGIEKLFFWCAIAYFVYRFIKQFRQLGTAIYAVTSQRIIICKKYEDGWYTSIPIVELHSRKHVPHRPYRGIPIGSIAFDCGKTETDSETTEVTKLYDYFEFIENPQEVFGLIDAPAK